MHRRTLSLVCGVLVALTGVIFFAAREQAILASPLLPVNFDHYDHAATRCATCHHNFLDDTGTSACYACHKGDRAVGPHIERDFHTFCRDCHVKLAEQGLQSGPVRRCGACHDPAAMHTAREPDLEKKR